MRGGEGFQQISSGNILEISLIVPSPDQKIFLPWARVWENYSGQNKGLFQVQNCKITMTSSENITFSYSVMEAADVNMLTV
jgi:hypothetical protein